MTDVASAAVLLSRGDIESGALSETWAAEAFASLRATLESRTEKFPCVFGVKGFGEGSLRFAFVAEAQADRAAAVLAPALREFARDSRRFGRYTSMVSFFELPVDLTLETYRAFFWDMLRALRRLDTRPWPEAVPSDPDDARWEFCFEDMPMFVVCATPSHVRRHSRRSATFVITFQPRWVFEGLEEDTRPGRQSRRVIRARLRSFDAVEAFPGLGSYGDPANREWVQYFLPEENDLPRGKCPMSTAMEVKP